MHLWHHSLLVLFSLYFCAIIWWWWKIYTFILFVCKLHTSMHSHLIWLTTQWTGSPCHWITESILQLHQLLTYSTSLFYYRYSGIIFRLFRATYTLHRCCMITHFPIWWVFKILYKKACTAFPDGYTHKFTQDCDGTCHPQTEIMGFSGMQAYDAHFERPQRSNCTVWSRTCEDNGCKTASVLSGALYSKGS